MTGPSDLHSIMTLTCFPGRCERVVVAVFRDHLGGSWRICMLHQSAIAPLFPSWQCEQCPEANLHQWPGGDFRGVKSCHRPTTIAAPKRQGWQLTSDRRMPQALLCLFRERRKVWADSCSIIPFPPFPTWFAWNSDLINDTLTGGSRSLHSAQKQSRRVAGCCAVETVYRHLFCLALAFHESSERCPSPVSPTGHLNLSKKIAPRGGSLGPSNIFFAITDLRPSTGEPHPPPSDYTISLEAWKTNNKSPMEDVLRCSMF